MRSRIFAAYTSILCLFCSAPAVYPAIYTVADGDVAGFKAAIQSANVNPGPDIISLAANGDYAFSTYHPTFNPADRTALPRITSEITIEGNGSVIRRSDSITFVVPEFRLFRISANGTLTLRAATVRNGSLGPVNGDWADANGSGLRNDGGNITLESCRFDNNHNSHWAAAVLTTGPAIVRNCEFAKNISLDGGTGAIRASNTSDLLIERCQFTENSGDDTIRVSEVENAAIYQCSVVRAGSGGSDMGMGIVIQDSTATLSNCTITDGAHWGLHLRDSNVTATHCTITAHGQINRPGRGLVLDGGVLNLRNSILALNYNGPAGFNQDCEVSSGTLNQTRNLIMDGSCNPDLDGDPKLGELGFYGGSTLVLPLVAGSPAINAGDDSVSEPIDQRGVSRPIGDHCDIGAYEGSVRAQRKWPVLHVDLLCNPEPYIIICDPLGPDQIMVAVAGSRTISARAIDPGSLSLGNAPGGSARALGLRDLNGDGIEDLAVQFRTAQVYSGVFDCESVTLLEMQGQTYSGQPLLGHMEVQALRPLSASP